MIARTTIPIPPAAPTPPAAVAPRRAPSPNAAAPAPLTTLAELLEAQADVMHRIAAVLRAPVVAPPEPSAAGSDLPAPVLLDAPAAAQALGVSERTLMRLTVATPEARREREELLEKQLAGQDEKGAAQSRERLAEMDTADLPCVRIGARVLYRPQALAEWAARHEETRQGG